MSPKVCNSRMESSTALSRSKTVMPSPSTPTTTRKTYFRTVRMRLSIGFIRVLLPGDRRRHCSGRLGKHLGHLDRLREEGRHDAAEQAGKAADHRTPP